jgi:hypothetical protein
VRVRVVALALALGILAACAPEDSNYSIPRCGQVTDSLIISAQAVPTAAKIPCLGPLPAGWSRGALHARDGLMEFVLDSDRAGISAVRVTLAVSCNFAGADEVGTDEPGTRKWSRIGDLEVDASDHYYYVFSGGCVEYEFDFEGEGRSALLVEIENSLGFVNRSHIQEEVADLGLQLDP